MQDTKLQPVVQTPAWIGIAIWPLIAMVVGLLALNVATLTNVMAAVGKAGAGKAVGEDAALERQPVAHDARLRLA